MDKTTSSIRCAFFLFCTKIISLDIIYSKYLNLNDLCAKNLYSKSNHAVLNIQLNYNRYIAITNIFSTQFKFCKRRLSLVKRKLNLENRNNNLWVISTLSSKIKSVYSKFNSKKKKPKIIEPIWIRRNKSFYYKNEGFSTKFRFDFDETDNKQRFHRYQNLDISTFLSLILKRKKLSIRLILYKPTSTNKIQKLEYLLFFYGLAKINYKPNLK